MANMACVDVLGKNLKGAEQTSRGMPVKAVHQQHDKHLAA